MSRQILVPIDESEPAKQALSHALSEFPNSNLIALHALDIQEESTTHSLEGGSMTLVDELAAEKREELKRLVEEIRARADDHTHELSVTVSAGPPAQTIVSYADKHDIDHVVIGSHGRTGARRILLGSVAEEVTRRAPVPVTVVR